MCCSAPLVLDVRCRLLTAANTFWTLYAMSSYLFFDITPYIDISFATNEYFKIYSHVNTITGNKTSPERCLPVSYCEFFIYNLKCIFTVYVVNVSIPVLRQMMIMLLWYRHYLSFKETPRSPNSDTPNFDLSSMNLSSQARGVVWMYSCWMCTKGTTVIKTLLTNDFTKQMINNK